MRENKNNFLSNEEKIKIIKKAMMDVIDAKYDHGFAIWADDVRVPMLTQANEAWSHDKERFHVLPFVPTAENLARHWFILLGNELESKYNIRLNALEVFETPTSSALFSIEDYTKEINEAINAL